MEYSDEDAPFEWEDPDHIDDVLGTADPNEGELAIDASASVNPQEFINPSSNASQVGIVSGTPSASWTEQLGLAIQSPTVQSDGNNGAVSGPTRLPYDRSMTHPARIRHEARHRAVYSSIPPRTDFARGSAFACRGCTYETQTYQGLERHLQSMLNLGAYVCPFCSRRYARPYLGRRHTAICLVRMKRKGAKGASGNKSPPGGNGCPPPGNGGSGFGGTMGGPPGGTGHGLLA